MATTFDKYHGTYPIRSLGHGAVGIQLPSTFTGDHQIWSDEEGNILLKRVERKTGR